MIKVVNTSNGVESEFTAEAWKSIQNAKEWKNVFTEVKPETVAPPKEIVEKRAEHTPTETAVKADEKNARASK